MERINVTATEAAELLCVSKAKVLNLLEQGEIPAYRDGSHWKIPYRLLVSYAESRAIVEGKERANIAREMKDDK